MDNAGSIALSRMIAQQQVLDIRASNIANSSTPGFKAGSVLFSDYLVRETGATVPGGQTEQMVQHRLTWRDFSPGEISKTGNPLDVALNTAGFFVIDTPRGERYTRAGRFSLSASGQIVDIEGNTVQGGNGQPLSVPQGDTRITVTSDGSVSSESGPIGTLHVVQFDSPQALRPEGGTLFSATETPRDMAQPGIMQGAVEGSNVSSVVEVTRMMAEMREFDFASQFVDGEALRQQSAIDHILRSS